MACQQLQLFFATCGLMKGKPAEYDWLKRLIEATARISAYDDYQNSGGSLFGQGHVLDSTNPFFYFFLQTQQDPRHRKSHPPGPHYLKVVFNSLIVDVFSLFEVGHLDLLFTDGRLHSGHGSLGDHGLAGEGVRSSDEVPRGNHDAKY